ncbi:MAG TPA: hypothetical protein VFQ61_16065 [Polyangiaceae bacterium]|nr:hypothetical protein [Polyangiaceae bacterium]
MKRSSLVLAAVAVMAGVVWLAWREVRPTPREAAPLAAEEEAGTPAPPPLSASAAPTSPSTFREATTPISASAGPRDALPSQPLPVQPTDAELMNSLHELGWSNPTKTLELARQGNSRFPSSANAPERASLIIRALSSLGRQEEARVEAKKMLETYPRSSWTEDVHKHMFVNPPTHPAEHGYGKEFELE